MTVFKRPNGKWVAQVWDPATGRPRQVGTFDLKKDAKAAEGAALAKRLTTTTTVAEFADTWLTLFPRKKQSTVLTHEQRISTFVAQFGKRKMASITVVEARAWAVDHAWAMQSPRAMYNDARRAGLVDLNPFSALGLETSPGRRNLPSGWLTLDEVHELRDIALHRAGFAPGWAPVMAGAIMIAAYTGIRPGELYALRHQDLGDDHIDISRSAESKSRTIGTPKNSFARRIVFCAQAREAVAQIPPSPNHDLVVWGPRGGQFWASGFGRYWDKIRCLADRPNMDFYELRHFCATHLLEIGLSHSDVAVQLGHRDGGDLVMKVYGHPSEVAARRRIKAALDGVEVGDLAARRRKAL